jgi:hypothetical protein
MNSRILIADVALAALSLFVTTTARAEVLVNQKSTFNTLIANPCNGEEIALHCDEHFILRETGNGNGFHFGVHLNVHCTGIGDLGNEYVVNFRDNWSYNSLQNAFNDVEVVTQTAVGKGGAPNFLIKIKYQFVWSNGEWHKAAVSVETKCVG